MYRSPTAQVSGTTTATRIAHLRMCERAITASHSLDQDPSAMFCGNAIEGSQSGQSPPLLQTRCCQHRLRSTLPEDMRNRRAPCSLPQMPHPDNRDSHLFLSLSFSAGRPATAAFPMPELSELAYPIDHHRYTRPAPAARRNPAGQCGGPSGLWTEGHRLPEPHGSG